MRILVDADACPMIYSIEQVAKEKKLEVILFKDVNHELQSDYSKIVTVGVGANAADIALVNECRKGDIVITSDSGLVTLAMSRGAYVINGQGTIYTDEKLDMILAEKYMSDIAKRNNQRFRKRKKQKKKKTCKFQFRDNFINTVELIQAGKVSNH